MPIAVTHGYDYGLRRLIWGIVGRIQNLRRVRGPARASVAGNEDYEG